jgi:hypothetical protein
MFGGERSLKATNALDILELGSDKWSSVSPGANQPTQRAFHTAAVYNDSIIFHGGKDGKTVHRDMYYFHTVSMTWSISPIIVATPSGRFGHSSVVYKDKLYLFGGTDGNEYFNNLIVFDFIRNEWSYPDVVGTPPTSRAMYGSCLLENLWIIHGGINANSKYLNDFKILNLNNLTWYSLRTHGIPASPRYGHSLSISGPDMIIYGGWGVGGCARMKIFNLENLEWMDSEGGEEPRYGHTANVVGSNVLIIGGFDGIKISEKIEIIMRN